MTPHERKKLFTGLAFISPWLIGFVVFMIYPVVMSAYYSFCDYDVLSEPVWVGTLNYQDMAEDVVFHKALVNTLIYALFSVPLGLILALLIAVLLNRPIFGRSAFRALFFLPSIVPIVVVGMIWVWIFNAEYGLMNYALSWLGIDGPVWLDDARWTKPALILSALWQIGGTIVLFLAGLQDVPRSLYESADIDGAPAWRKLWHITVPMISPVIYFNGIIALITALQEFARPFIIFGTSQAGGTVAVGGPDRSALLYAVYLYQNAFGYGKMGYASAMAWVLFLMILILTLAATRLSRRHIYYAGD